MYCRVERCRFPHAHSTLAHKCGRCDEFGHGVLECHDNDKKTHLYSLENIYLPIDRQCTIPGCMYPETHINGSHHCHYCLEQDHGERDCIIKEMGDYRGKYNDLENDLQGMNNIYFVEYSGMGSQIYIRKKDWIINFMIMTEDSWGRYSELRGDVLRLNRFTHGLREIGAEQLSSFSQFDESVDFVQPTVPIAAIDPSNPNEYPTSGRASNNGWHEPANQIEDDGGDIAIPIVDMTERELHENYNNYLASFNNNNTGNVKCPLCRTINDKRRVTKIKGLGVECSVCFSNNVSLYFPTCEHACVCQECFDQL